VIRTTQIHCLLVNGLAVAFVLSLSGLASADSSESPLHIFSVGEKDFRMFESPNGKFPVAAPMDVPGMSGGIARLVKGENELKDWTYWYPEVVYVTRGKGRVTGAAPPFNAPKIYDVSSGDFFFIPAGIRIGFEVLSDEPFEFFFAKPTD